MEENEEHIQWIIISPIVTLELFCVSSWVYFRIDHQTGVNTQARVYVTDLITIDIVFLATCCFSKNQVRSSSVYPKY